MACAYWAASVALNSYETHSNTMQLSRYKLKFINYNIHLLIYWILSNMFTEGINRTCTMVNKKKNTREYFLELDYK